MYNRESEFDGLYKEAFDMPQTMEISTIKKTVKRKVFVHRVIATTRNMAIACVMFVGTIAIGVNSSPAFADAVSKIPFIGGVARAVDFNDSYKDAIENDYITEVKQTKETEIGDVTLDYYIADEKRIVFVFNGEFKEKYEDVIIEHISLKNLDNNEEGTSSQTGSNMFNEEGYASIEMGLWPKGWGYPKNLEVTADIVGVNYLYDDETGEVLEAVEAPVIVTYDLELEPCLSAREYSVNETFEIKGQKITVDKVIMYPTCTSIKYTADENNSMEVLSLDMHLVDGNGVKNNDKPSVVFYDYDETPLIGSGYFSLGSDVKLVVDEVDLLPKNMVDVTLDTKTLVLSDGNGVLENIYVPQNEDFYEKYGRFLDREEVSDGNKVSYEYRVVPVVAEVENLNWAVGFEAVDDNGEPMDEYFECFESGDGVNACCIQKSFLEQQGEVVHLKREFPEYLEKCNISVDIGK